MSFEAKSDFSSCQMNVRGLVVAVCAAMLLSSVGIAYAESPYAAPDGGKRFNYGPDHQGSESKRPVTGNSGRIDAYGNPVTPLEEEEKPSRRAILPKASAPTRPLPDVNTDAGWNF